MHSLGTSNPKRSSIIRVPLANVAHKSARGRIVALEPLPDVDAEGVHHLVRYLVGRQDVHVLLGHVPRRAVVHEDVVKGLVPALGQAVDVVLRDPGLFHVAVWVPAVDDGVVAAEAVPKYLADVVLDVPVARVGAALGRESLVVGLLDVADESAVGCGVRELGGQPQEEGFEKVDVEVDGVANVVRQGGDVPTNGFDIMGRGARDDDGGAEGRVVGELDVDGERRFASVLMRRHQDVVGGADGEVQGRRWREVRLYLGGRRHGCDEARPLHQGRVRDGFRCVERVHVQMGEFVRAVVMIKGVRERVSVQIHARRWPDQCVDMVRIAARRGLETEVAGNVAVDDS